MLIPSCADGTEGMRGKPEQRTREANTLFRS